MASLRLSNADAPFVHELYAGHHIERVAARRAINSKGAKRGVTSEVIVTKATRRTKPSEETTDAGDDSAQADWLD